MQTNPTWLERRAIEEKWPIPQEYKDAIIQRFMHEIANPNTKPRARAIAAKIILAATGQNIQIDRNDLARQQLAMQGDQADGQLNIIYGTLEHPTIEGPAPNIGLPDPAQSPPVCPEVRQEPLNGCRPD